MSDAMKLHATVVECILQNYFDGIGCGRRDAQSNGRKKNAYATCVYGATVTL